MNGKDIALIKALGGGSGGSSGGGSITVDSTLSATSTNPVQNKVIKAALDELASAAVTDDHINSLIDTKLGVIENGSY